jgi:putative transposase
MRYSQYFAAQHANGQSMWHFEWCTKYRYKIFRAEEHKNLCRIAIIEAAKLAQVQVLELEVEPEHLHMIVEIPLRLSPLDAVRELKSVSARLLFRLMPKLAYRYPKRRLWSAGKFVMSVGYITLEKAKEYVNNQKAHHAKAFSRWESPLRSGAKELPEGQGLAPGRMSKLGQSNNYEIILYYG